MATLITRAGNAAALSANQHDENLKRETNPQSGNYTVVADDNRATIEYTGAGSHTITLPDVSTLLVSEDTGDYQVTIKNNGTGTVTIAPAALNTIDGVDVDLSLGVGGCVTLKAGSVTDDWMLLYRSAGAVYGTSAISATGAAPQDITIVHGLGTDNVDVDWGILNNSASWSNFNYTLSVTSNNVVKFMEAPSYASGYLVPDPPASGSVLFRIAVAGSFTGTLYYTIRARG